MEGFRRLEARRDSCSRELTIAVSPTGYKDAVTELMFTLLLDLDYALLNECRLGVFFHTFLEEEQCRRKTTDGENDYGYSTTHVQPQMTIE
jgi:hypothetical protein